LTHKQIAEELNNSGKLPNNNLITRDDVDRFMKRVPSIEKALVKESKAKAKAYELSHNKNFPSVQVGKRIIIPRPAIQKWMENPIL
jgi:hypothetical protein